MEKGNRRNNRTKGFERRADRNSYKRDYNCDLIMMGWHDCASDKLFTQTIVSIIGRSNSSPLIRWLLVVGCGLSRTLFPVPRTMTVVFNIQK